MPNNQISGISEAPAFALRFISGKYQGGEFSLPTKGEVVIGRSSELDMVLVEDMVSRRHSRISVDGTDLSIEDLGSTNGTFVNGEKVKHARLREGDRILVGTSIIKVVVSDPSSRPAPMKMEEPPSRRSSQVRTMTGSISEVPLPDLLQLFSASKKSGVLVVRTDSDHGRIYLDEGNIVFATINGDMSAPPDNTLVRILTWTEGTFDMDPPENVEFPTRLNSGTEALLMDAMRQIDELRRLNVSLPTESSPIQLPKAFSNPLRSLGPEELDVMELVHGAKTVGEVLNRSPLSGVRTAEILDKLIKGGYALTN